MTSTSNAQSQIFTTIAEQSHTDFESHCWELEKILCASNKFSSWALHRHRRGGQGALAPGPLPKHSNITKCAAHWPYALNRCHMGNLDCQQKAHESLDSIWSEGFTDIVWVPRSQNSTILCSRWWQRDRLLYRLRIGNEYSACTYTNVIWQARSSWDCSPMNQVAHIITWPCIPNS